MDTDCLWSRCVLLVDLDAFFGSIEQRDYPELAGRPVAVTNGARGTCIITASYEARCHGVKTGMRLAEARALCPGLVRRPSRPAVYAAVSTAIMAVLGRFTPDIEVFSVDEAFLDVSACQRLLGPPEAIARQVRDAVRRVSGLSCSVGVAGDKTCAKYAAGLHKPGGIGVIPPWEAADRLRDVPVEALCGIAGGIRAFLAERGVRVCGDMARLPISVLGRRFGDIGRRIWLIAQGRDPAKVVPTSRAAKSLGHGKVLPPGTRDTLVLRAYLAMLCDRLAGRLRAHRLVACVLQVSLLTGHGWFSAEIRPVRGEASGATIARAAWQALGAAAGCPPFRQLHIAATRLASEHDQADLFCAPAPRGLDAALDAIHQRFGRQALVRGVQLVADPLPDVISPAWRPDGVRRSV